MDIQPLTTRPQPPDRVERVRAAAEALESNFLNEMLKSAGLGDLPDPFSGGSTGGDREESQFASFLREAQADRIVQSGGIGLAEVIFKALQGRSNV